MLYGYFYWWYGAGFVQSWRVAAALLYEVADFFSLEILLRTLFAPWKNDVLQLRNAALGDQVKVWEQNLVSRIVGFILRTVVILVGLLVLSLMTIVLGIGLVLWLAVPFLIFILPVVAVWVVGR